MANNREVELDEVLPSPLADTESKAVVLVFVARECPISNRYAPEINRLVAEYSSKGIAFWAVYTGYDDTADLIRKHQSDFNYSLSPLIDRDFGITKRARASVTPEVAVYVSSRLEEGESPWVYRGRIDDQYLDFGKWRATPKVRDLEEVLVKIDAGLELTPKETRAVGCYIYMGE